MNMKDNLENLMQQAQQVQQDMQKIQEELTSMEIEADAGAGAVSVTMTGRHDVRRVSINDENLLQVSEKEMLEALLAAAVNAANKKVESAATNRMSDFTKGLGLPTDMNLPTGQDTE